MDKLQLEELREIVESLSDIFKCAVCLEFLQGEPVMCVNGHTICGKCQGKQKDCPSCRDDFSNVKQIVLVRQVLEILPRPCIYQCSNLVRSGDEHELYCFNKPLDCKRSNCNWVGPGAKLCDHYKKEHSKLTIFNEKNDIVCTFNPAVANLNHLLFHAFGHLLWQIRDNNPESGLCTYTYVLVHNGKPSHDIFVKHLYKSDRLDYTVNLKINVDPNVNPNENSIFIPCKVLKQFVNQELSKFSYSMLITKSKE